MTTEKAKVRIDGKYLELSTIREKWIVHLSDVSAINICRYHGRENDSKDHKDLWYIINVVVSGKKVIDVKNCDDTILVIGSDCDAVISTWKSIRGACGV